MQPLAEWMNKKEWIPRHDSTFVWWTYFESSGWVRLPFTGGMADQPIWWWEDVMGYNDIAEFHQLFFERERLTKRQLKVLSDRVKGQLK